MSEQPKFTPGPWEKWSGYFVGPKNYHGLTQVLPARYLDDATNEANLNLIAAAPELYDALDKLCRAIISYTPTEAVGAHVHKAALEGVFALRKARGEVRS